MNKSIQLSIKRIRKFGDSNPMLLHDAEKLADYVESTNEQAEKTVDCLASLVDDPHYQEFVEGQRKHCRCTSRIAPCDGVLAGGMCDNIQDDPEDERRCFFCSQVDCDGRCEF